MLLPLILVAFWPGYFGHLREAPLALHGHGISASAWLMLLAFQLWSIHARRMMLHRTAGLALFVVVPVFAGASLAAIQAGFVMSAAQSDPFHVAFSARLGMVDLIALCTLIGLVRHALVTRRSARTHASAMLATSLLVLPPILARLVPLVPNFADMAIAGRQGFVLAFHVGQGLAAVAALTLYLADRKARAFLVVAVSIGVQSLMFETVGTSALWAALTTQAATIPPAALALTGALAAAAVLYQGWIRIPPRRRSSAEHLRPATDLAPDS
ncbi:hypothetical protein [Sphingomonas sp. R86520]|uniref:hypothetical protein n=1 Tax=Sphingomonas sp. R86520 TaxID=3093859 RepID=UPI0036D2BD87